LDFYGVGWSEAKKLSSLKLFLDGMPRRLFDNLNADERDTLEKALKNMRNAMDLPQRRELTYQALADCKQKDGETVKTFLERLIPLVEATSVNYTAEAKEETLCRTLLEKLKPDISLILRMAGLAGRKNFEELCMQAQEVEMILVGKSKNNPTQNVNTFTSNNSGDPWRSNYQNFTPTNIPQTLRGSENNNQNLFASNSQSVMNSANYCEYCQMPRHFARQYEVKIEDLMEENDQLHQENEELLDKLKNFEERLWRMKLQLEKVGIKF
jgi:hypothetical protein